MNTYLIEIADEDIWDMLPGFLSNRHRDVEALTSALATASFPTIQRLGHNMKGAGAAYGFPEITTIGAALETAARSSDAPTARALTARLADYLVRVHPVPAFTPEEVFEASPIATAA